jgi:hypothetical protein
MMQIALFFVAAFAVISLLLWTGYHLAQRLEGLQSSSGASGASTVQRRKDKGFPGRFIALRVLHDLKLPGGK